MITNEPMEDVLYFFSMGPFLWILGPWVHTKAAGHCLGMLMTSPLQVDHSVWAHGPWSVPQEGCLCKQTLALKFLVWPSFLCSRVGKVSGPHLTFQPSSIREDLRGHFLNLLQFVLI